MRPSATDVSSDAGPTPRLRVVHVIHSLGPGGAESVLVELAGVADAAGLDLVVVALSPVPHAMAAEALRELGVPVVQLDLPRWDPRAVLGTLSVLRTHRPHVVHTHLKHADLVGTAAAAVLGLPVVSTLHVVEETPAGRLGGMKRTAGLAARRLLAARTVALSSRQREWYVELAGSDADLVVLPNGVADPGVADPADLDRLRAELGATQGRPLIVSASLMRPEKGHALLLDAVSSLPAGVDPVVALAGDGPLRRALENRVASDPLLRDRVRFLGYRQDVPALLAAADLVLHTSLADALPTTLMQALAVGVPIVATGVGGIPDIVGDQTGVLVPAAPREVAAAVADLLADPDRRARMGTAGRSRFLAQFEAAGWASRLRDLYGTVLAEHTPRRRVPGRRRS